jgi:NaMN:DMB phosphoribosyltransferase
MDWQQLFVVIIVSASALQGLWLLLGNGLRRRVATRLARLPLPATWVGRLNRVTARGQGCACDGCAGAVDSTRPRAASVGAPIRIVRRGLGPPEQSSPTRLH